jgi:hypothetical protein
MLTTSNHLLSRLLHTTPEAAEHLERVILSPGLWPMQGGVQETGHVYFPEAGLVGLLWPSSALPGLGMVLLGCHSGWWPELGRLGPVQTHVLQAGHAQRMRCSLLQAQPQRYAPWLLQAAAASQQLVHQMALKVHCVQNHALVQRLASGLLAVRQHNPHSDGQMSVTDWAHWLSCPVAELQDAARALQAHGAVQLAEDAGAVSPLHSLQPQKLSRLACACHEHLAQDPGSSGSASA